MPDDQGGGLDPQLMQQLLAQFPGLEGMRQSPQQQQPNALAGYQFPGITFIPGQGSPQSLGNLSPFEGAKGFGSESITAGLALGNYGKSSSQQATPGGAAQPFSLGQLNLPSLALPQAVAAQQGGFGADASGLPSTPAEGDPTGGITIGAGDVVGAGQKVAGMFDLGTGTAFDPTQQTQQPGMQQQRAGERTDYSNVTGSPSGIPQALAPLATSAPPGFGGADTTFSLGNQTPPLSPGGFQAESFSMPGAEQTMFAPGGSAQAALGPGPTDWMGVAQGGLGALGGLANIYGGAQAGDIGGAAMGGLQTVGGLTSALQSSPELAGMLGLDAGALSGIGGAAGGIGGLYSLYQGIQSGDPVQMATGALSAYMGGASLYGAITGTAAPGVLTGLSTIAPGAMASIASTLSGTAVASTAAPSAIAGTISAAASAWALPVAAVAVFVVEVLANMERERIMDAGFTNNPIKGALYSASTEGVANANSLLEQIAQGGGLEGADTYDLASILTGGMDQLMPYYATAQGGRGPIRASDTLTGGHGSSKSEPLPGGDIAAYEANAAKARQGLVGVVNELMRRGVTYEQLGQLPLSQDWAQQTLDAGNRPEDMYALGGGRYDAEAAQLQSLARQFGEQPGAGQWVQTGSDESGPQFTFTAPSEFRSGLAGLNLTPLDMLRAAQGAGAEGPDAITKAGGSVTSMYGGPLWAALARSGAAGDSNLMNMIQQNFDPWVNARHSTAADLYHSLDPIITPQLQGRPDTSMWSAQGGGAPIGGPRAAATQGDFWSNMASQRAMQDPMVQQLQQYQQQLQALQGGLPQLQQGLQQQGGAGLDPGVLAALQSTGFGGAPNTGGAGGIDLQALLRQMGLTPMAEGGIVTKPTAALIGEAGPEAVIPLENLNVPFGRGTMGGDESRSQQEFQGPQHWNPSDKGSYGRIGDQEGPISRALVSLIQMMGGMPSPPPMMQPRARTGYGADADLSEFMRGLTKGGNQYLNMGPSRYR